MEIRYDEIYKMPVITIDNFFTDHELGVIKKEIDFLTETSMFSYDNNFTDKESLNSVKKNKTLFTDGFYLKNENSPSYCFIQHKLRDRKFLAKISEYHPHLGLLFLLDSFNLLFSYYEDGDFYDTHLDYCPFTLLGWLFEQPKKFHGGNLIIQKELEIECKFNRFVIMPHLEHKVTTIKMKEQFKNQKLGRYTLSAFLTQGPWKSE